MIRLHMSVGELNFIQPAADLTTLKEQVTWGYFVDPADRSGMDRGVAAHVGGGLQPPPWWPGRASQGPARRPFHLFKVTDSFAFPKHGVIATADGGIPRSSAAEACYFDHTFANLPFCTRVDDETWLTPPADVRHVAKAIISIPRGGTINPNYGHFLLDGMSTVASIRDMGLTPEYQLITPPLNQWQRRHFEILGIEPVEVDDELIYCDEILFSDAMDHNLHKPSDNYRILAEAGRVACPPGGTRRVYLSRDGQKNRVNETEAQLVEMLQRHAFEISDPSSLSVDEQISLLAGADVVVACSGAALANALYCSKNALVVEIQPQGMENTWVWSIADIIGFRFAAYFPDKSMIADPTKPEQALRFSVKVDNFEAFLIDNL